jgi:hypothetical protein
MAWPLFNKLVGAIRASKLDPACTKNVGSTSSATSEARRTIFFDFCLDTPN